jgi:magnesium transporter
VAAILHPAQLTDPVSAHTRGDFALLRQSLTVAEALAAIRERGVGERIIYFYVVDDDDRLTGVVPTRRLLSAKLEDTLSEIMIRQVVAIPQAATVLEACEFFLLHKFLAFPVVDEQRRLSGVVEIGLFTDEVFDLAEREQSDAIFEAMGFRLAQVRDASPLRAFRYRFPWLVATIASGSLCALLTSAFAVTLGQCLVLAFFLTLVLGLGESVSIQSMTVTIQALRAERPSRRWYLRQLRREAQTSVLLGLASGLTVGSIVWVWRGEPVAGAVIGSGILLSLVSACAFGLSVPSLLHALRLDPKIAAGPITLALTDIFTLLFYFSLAAFFL